MGKYYYEQMGKCIRNLRKEKGITIRELCDGIYNEASFSKIENGKAMPHPEKIDKIAARLGEKNFYETFFMKDRYSTYMKKAKLKKSVKYDVESGQLEKVEEKLIQLKSLIEDADSEDMQFYLTLQTIWYEMNGVKLKNRSKRYIEIYEMKKNFPPADADVKKLVKEGSFSETDYLLVNNVGLSLLKEEKYDLAAKTLVALYTEISEKMPDGPKKKRQLSIVGNNCAKALLKMNNVESAEAFCKRSLEYSLKAMDIKLLVSALTTESEIMEKTGHHDLAVQQLDYVEALENTLGLVSETVGVELQFGKIESGIAVL